MYIYIADNETIAAKRLLSGFRLRNQYNPEPTTWNSVQKPPHSPQIIGLI